MHFANIRDVLRNSTGPMNMRAIGCPIIFFLRQILLLRVRQSWKYIKMKKGRSLGSRDLAVSEDMAIALTSLRNLITPSKSSDSDQKITERQQEKLNRIFVKTKKERIRDIFIQKLKRALITHKPEQITNKQEEDGPFGLLIEAVQFPEHIAHAVVLTNVIVVLILMVLATFEGFIDNFRVNKQFAAVFTLKIICLVINVLYFILKCSNKSFGNGQNHKYIHQVLKAYATSGRFFLDFLTIAIQIATLIFPDVMAISGVFFFFLIIVLFFTLSDLIQIEAAYLHSERAFLLWGLVKICLSNIIFAHFMASFILAMSWIDTDKNWMTRVGINEEEWFVKYFYSFYWGTTIMMTVGFGDVLPGNPNEVIITSFLEMFSCILLGYNISQIGHLISQLRQKNEIVNRKLAVFDRMVKSRNYEDKEKSSKFHQLQKSIYNHIKQLNNGDNNLEYSLRAELLAELPEHLRKAYYQEANQRIFTSVLFFNRLKPSTVEEMAEKFQSKFYYAGEKLVESKEKIMILEEGSIGLGFKKRGSMLNGQIFDQVSVKKGNKTILLTTTFLSLFREKNHELIAQDQSIVWGISFNDFIDTLRNSIIDYQYYFSVLHKHTNDDDEWCSVSCPRCSTEVIHSFHSVYDCPRIVYMPLRQIAFLKQISVGNNLVIRRGKRQKKRNQYSKMSVFLHKKTFNKLIEQIDIAKNRIAPLFDEYEPQISRCYDEDQMLPAHPQSTNNFSRQQLMDLMEAAIRKYETGYENGFWDLELDSINNYQFYFPNNNVNRLHKKSLYTPRKTLQTRDLLGQKQIQSEESIVLNS